MKRLTSIFLVLAMLLTLAPMNIFAAENDETAFSDMKTTDYYAKAATALEELEIISGYPDGTYGAEKSITRAEMAAIVCRIIDKETDAEKAKGETIFDDVASDYWASGYINIAVKEGIINGDGNGKFRPEDEVKYEEAIKMIVCALDYADDIETDPADWSKAYLDIADDKGITSDLKIKKGEPATRGDIAVMSYNGLATESEDSKIPATPVASVKAGEYKGTQKVKLSTVTKDSDIYYTTDGTTPTVKSNKYKKEISINKTSTLKAISVKNGVVSKDVMSIDYTIKKVSSGGGGGSSRPSTPTYTVSFDLNYEGATAAPANQSIRSGNKATEPTAPEREGYIFLGWSTSENEEILFDFTSAVTSSITLYALWANGSSGDTYSVTFILNDGSAGAYEMQRVPAYGYATKPEDPERELYEFTGWYTEEEAINEFDFNTRITSDLVLFAGWGAPDGEADLYAAGSGGGTYYSITGIEFVDNQVSVTVNTNDSSILVVKFLNEATEEIITTVSTQTPSYCELVPVVIPVTYELPEHFIMVADLYDDTSTKLCDSFRSIKNTTNYKAFDNQTINDFEEDRVISFDGDENNNFGVFSENVKRINSSESTNTLTVEQSAVQLAAEEEQLIADRIYVFENPDESILSLSVGDSVYINGTSYLFKIASIENVDGKIIITESDDVELKDFYDVLKVNMEINPADTDDSEVELMWDAVDIEPSFTLGGNINWTPKDWLKVSGGLSGTGKIKVEISYDWKWFEDDYFYIAVIASLDLKVNLGVEVTLNNEDAVDRATKDVTEIVLAKIDVPTPVPGLTIEVKPSVPLELELAGGVKFEFSTQMETGFTYSSYDGKQNIDRKERTVKIEAEGKASAKFGPKIKVAVQFCNGVLDAGINAGAGIEAKAETSIGYENTTAESKHDCTLCLDGTISWYAEVYADASYKLIEDILEGDIGEWYIIKATGDFPISPNFYISLINNADSVLGGRIKFGWGDCPNEAYRTRIIVKDADGNEVNGVNVSIQKQGGNISKSGASPFTAYLYNGNYTISANIENENVSKTIVVSGDAQDVVLTAESDDGSVFGMVVDSSNNNPVSGATVIISQNGTIVATTTSGSDGSYQVSLGDGTFNIETTKDGYLPFNEYVTITNAATTYLQTTKLEPGDEDAKGGFSGRIVNSVNGEAIKGVTLKLRRGWNNRSEGDVVETLSTDENGNFLYEIKELFGTPIKLEVGNYTLIATKEGFATTSHNIIVRPNMVTGGQDFSMSPSLGDVKYRIVLRWGLNPYDLDSHLVGPTPNGGSFHTWYREKRHSENGSLVAALDLDDTTSYGPETTTIHETADGKYYFYVHHYSGSGSIASTSAASVEVYKGDEKIATYNAPLNQGNGRYWNVFVLDAVTGTITPVNTITDSPNTSLVSLYGEDVELSENDILSIIAEDIANSPKE